MSFQSEKHLLGSNIENADGFIIASGCNELAIVRNVDAVNSARMSHKNGINFTLSAQLHYLRAVGCQDEMSLSGRKNKPIDGFVVIDRDGSRFGLEDVGNFENLD